MQACISNLLQEKRTGRAWQDTEQISRTGKQNREKFGMDQLISVIIPAYNIEAYLPRCLSSMIEAGSILYPHRECRAEAGQLRAEIKRNADSFGLLSRNERIKARLFCMCPGAYSRLYGLFGRYMRRKVYE